MKILVLNTESRLEKEAKEILREEVRKAAQIGVIILDGGMSLEVIEIDKLSPMDGLNPGVPIYDETVETL
ncbi:phage portal protein [Bacillus altitudinis]|uniref:hypothetical protein n=1 Tax=Bacillus altitudinis TaxID=293387 RepID=UPI0022477527|nr:hypothetical protein [Bacillus altitudinis]KAJ0073376.1 phage portal protein [Bacillus altitudinis]